MKPIYPPNYFFFFLQSLARNILLLACLSACLPRLATGCIDLQIFLYESYTCSQQFSNLAYLLCCCLWCSCFIEDFFQCYFWVEDPINLAVVLQDMCLFFKFWVAESAVWVVVLGFVVTLYFYHFCSCHEVILGCVHCPICHVFFLVIYVLFLSNNF